MSELILYLGNKNYSSWSFRPWSAMEAAGVPFTDTDPAGLEALLSRPSFALEHRNIVPEGLRDYAQVVAYLSSPVIVVLEIAFLVTVAWHGLLGLRAVIFDLGLSARAETWVTRVLAVVGVVLLWFARKK